MINYALQIYCVISEIYSRKNKSLFLLFIQKKNTTETLLRAKNVTLSVNYFES